MSELCKYDECDQQAVYCEGHAGEFVADALTQKAYEIERLQARIEKLEGIICDYADPTGAPEDEFKLIMGCHGWYREEKALAATEQGESDE